MKTERPDRRASATDESRNGQGHHHTLAISNALVRLISQRAGRGPTRVRTTLTPELAVVTIRDWLTTAEKNLLQHGHRALVLSGRAALSDGMREEACAAVEEITGSPVVAYLSTHDPEPDIAVAVFLFESPRRLRGA